MRAGHVGQIGRPDHPHPQVGDPAAGSCHVGNLEYRHVTAVTAAALEVPPGGRIRLRGRHYLDERVADREHCVSQPELCHSRIMKWLRPAESQTQLVGHPAAVLGDDGNLAQARSCQHSQTRTSNSAWAGLVPGRPHQ